MFSGNILVNIYYSSKGDQNKNLKKGGTVMNEEVNNVDVKVEVCTRAKKGFEDLYDLATAKIANLEEEIAKEFAARKAELISILNSVSETYEVVVPVEVPTEETVASTEVTA